MKNYSHYQPDDFVQDPYFRKWALGQLPADDTFWTTWRATHPEQYDTLEQAKSLVVALRIESAPTDPAEVETAIAQILSGIETPVFKPPFFQNRWVQFAAMLVVVAGIGYGFWWNGFPSGRPKTLSNRVDSEQQREEFNSTPSPKTIRLSDGSEVILEPASRLLIKTGFGNVKREVQLTGEAFFQVTKNPEKPFLVYTGNVVTKVLGTSFRIKAYDADANVSVAVRTGKVTVFKQTAGQATRPTLSDEIILTPNQQAVFVKADDRLVKTLVEKPVMLSKPADNQPLEFSETPIPTVFSSLEKSYGVKMIFDPDLLKDCNLTGTLTNGSFYEKLTLVCETIQARYEVVDGQVVIYGRGCK
ncbi:FecR family protein [Larkinella rosea]|uniref:FecR family protein n=1 Tax=Larkinella rosea TaxID=2025312 RepID=A0A3P1C3E1_9BACT|nr:FecR family protein [Larkinella rosea]RRB07583.1 FecR family protein [Larkinella rosea]